MHPKSLLDLSIDCVVYTTLSYQKQGLHHQTLWMKLRQLWKELWVLPPRIHAQAVYLLHSHLVCGPSFYRAPRVMNQPLLTLLAVKSSKIAFVPVSRHLATLRGSSVFEDCGVFSEELRLQTLDLSGVDLGLSLRFLLALLPRCPVLSVLKLGGNTTPEVLKAAKSCPIVTLHIDERLVYKPRVSETILLETVMGITGVSTVDVMDRVRHGEPFTKNPPWPNLTDLSTGFCKLGVHFFVLAFIVFQNLQYLESKKLNLVTSIYEYYNFNMGFLSFPSLSLKSCTVLANTVTRKELFTIFPKLEYLDLVINGSVARSSISDILRLTEKFSSLTAMSISHVRHLDPDESLRGMLTVIGKQLKVLEIQGGLVEEISLKDFAKVLQLCPLLQELTVYFLGGIVCDDVDLHNIYSFKTVTSFSCKLTPLEIKSLMRFLHMFPNLELVAVQGKMDNMDEFIDCLKEFPELRVVKLSEQENLDISRLCELPRATRDNRQWELHIDPNRLTDSDVTKVLRSGWCYVPLVEYFHTFSQRSMKDFS